MSELIERDAVLDTIHRFFTEEVDKIPTKKTEDGEVYVIHKCQPLFEMNKAICKRIKALPSVTAEQTHEEWCTDCKEYDQEQHCCHRYCKVIRQAVDEIKQAERTVNAIPIKALYELKSEVEKHISQPRGYIKEVYEMGKDNAYENVLELIDMKILEYGGDAE